jgi:hypothetical protein
MAELLVDAKWLKDSDCKAITDTQLYDALRAALGLTLSDEIAFGLLVIDNGTTTSGTPTPRFMLLTSPRRSPVFVNWYTPTQKEFPSGTRVTPDNGEVLVITYPGDPNDLYRGVCTKVNGVPVWF